MPYNCPRDVTQQEIGRALGIQEDFEGIRGIPSDGPSDVGPIWTSCRRSTYPLGVGHSVTRLESVRHWWCLDRPKSTYQREV